MGNLGWDGMGSVNKLNQIDVMDYLKIKWKAYENDLNFMHKIINEN